MQVTWEEAYWEACAQLGNALTQKSLVEKRALLLEDDQQPTDDETKES